jgi:hypothetical protein
VQHLWQHLTIHFQSSALVTKRSAGHFGFSLPNGLTFCLNDVAEVFFDLRPSGDIIDHCVVGICSSGSLVYELMLVRWHTRTHIDFMRIVTTDGEHAP